MTKEFKDKVEFEHCTVLAVTPKAVLVQCLDWEPTDQWVPQSQIDVDSEVWKEGDEGTLVVSRWLAEQKGWI